MIFAKMSPIRKWQRRFLVALFSSIFALRGRVNFTNLARFCALHEQTFRRQFAAFFDWIEFNLAVLELASKTGEARAGEARAGEAQLIAAIDCTFAPKSGKRTWGLDRFWSSTLGKARRGLEVSLLALIETESGRSWSIDATQTPPDLAAGEQGETSKKGKASTYTRVDFYLEQLADCLRRGSSICSKRLDGVQHFVADGFYAKTKFLRFLTARGKHLVTRLRPEDANLRFLYTGPRKKGPGKPKRYDGKVRWDDLSRFDSLGVLDDRPHIEVYTKLLNSPHFKRDFRVVVLLNTSTSAYVVLASTNAEQPAREVVRFYRLRFQIELIFRDAKQFAGLTHSQARSQEKLDFHFNMAFAAVNIARLEILLYRQAESLNSYVRRAYNTRLVRLLLSKLGLEDQFDLTHPQIQQVVQVGSMVG